MFLSLIQKRRSIRQFTDVPVEQEKIEKLIRAALWSPSSRRLNPWEFLIVTDKNLLEKLGDAKPGAGFLKGAPLGIVVIADPSICDVWIEDSSIASTLLLFEALDLGLGACWAQIRFRNYNRETTAEEYVSGLLNIPANYCVESIIGIGYPAEEPEGHGEEELDFKKIHYNGFGKSRED